MHIHLSTAVPSDMSLLVPSQFAAFHPNNKMHRLIYPSPLPVSQAAIQSTITRQLSHWEADPHVTWLVIKDSDSIITLPSGETTERIVAAAKWVIWKAGETATWPKKGKLEVDWIPKEKIAWDEKTGNVAPFGAADDREYVTFVLEQFYASRRAKINGPGVLLDVCFTDPGYQGKGAGKMLVKWGCERADELGVRAFVEASPEGRRLYESAGFVAKEEVELRGDDVEKGEREEWGMYGVADWIFMDREPKEA